MNQGDLYCVKWLGVEAMDGKQEYLCAAGLFVDEPIKFMQKREVEYRAWLREKPMNEAGRQLWETMWREANQQ